MTKQLKNKNSTSVIRGSFDGIANKFDANIYGTSKGKLRHQLLVHHLSNYIDNGFLENTKSAKKSKLDVLDIGGGTGMMSLEFALQGHHVNLFDISTDVLEVARQRLAEYSNASVKLAGINDVKESYDVIVCHAVLEWLDEPLHAIRKLVSHLNENGVLSISFFNQDAKIFSNLLYGNFDYVNEGLPARNTVRLNPHNAQQPSRVLAFINDLDSVDIVSTNGIRCIHDYMLDKSRIEPQYDKLFALELKYGAIDPYKWLGKYFHIILRKKPSNAVHQH